MSHCSECSECSEGHESYSGSEKSTDSDSSYIVHVHSAQEYEDSKRFNGLAVLKYSATWCGPCNQSAPYYLELAKEYPNVRFVHVDVNTAGLDEVGEVMDVAALPTFRFFKNGKFVDQFAGANNTKLLQFVQKYVNM